MQAGAGNIEYYQVIAGQAVGIDNSLAQRTPAAIVGIGNEERATAGDIVI